MRFAPANTYRRSAVTLLSVAALSAVGLTTGPAAGAATARNQAQGPAAGTPQPPPRPAPFHGPQVPDRPDPVVHQPVGSAPPIPSGTWQPLGPAAIGPSSSAFSGRVTSLVVIPSGTHAGRIVIGTAGGGIWTSDDNGTTWTARTDSFPDLAIGSLADDPSTPDHLVAGTGEGNNSADSFYGDGVLTSSDGGATWTRQDPSNMFDGLHIEQIAIDPTDSNHQFAATDGGLFVTTNGGTSWAQPTDPSYAGVAGTISSVVIDPSNHNNVYIGTTHTGLVAKSTDGGLTWAISNSGITASAVSLVAFAIDPSNTSTVYVSLGGTNAVKLYKSTDGGGTWSQLSGAPDYTGQAYYYGSGSFEQGWYDNVIAVDPTNSQHLVAGGIALTQSTDGGATWSKINIIHPDQHALFFTSTGDLWNGCDGGVFLDTHTGTFSDKNGNLNITQFYFGFNVVGNTLLAGSQDNGTVLTSNVTSVSAWNEVLGGDGGPSAIVPNNPSMQFAEATGGLYMTTNSWNTAPTYINPFSAGDFTPPMIIEPNSTTPSQPTVFLGGSDLYRTTNPANPASWAQVTNIGSDVSAIAASPSNPQVVYVGFNDGTIQVSTDGGTTWSSLASESRSDTWVTGISVDPTNPQAITASFSYNDTRYFPGLPHVEQYSYSTTPGNGTWTTITGSGLPNAVSHVVYDHGDLLAATDSGVYATSSVSAASTSWTRVGSAMPNVQVQDLFVKSDGSVYAVTHGRGAWVLPPAGLAVASVTPNTGPGTGGTNITINGTGFSAGDTVVIGQGSGAGTGRIAATNVNVVSPTQITATTGGGAKGGTWNVFVVDSSNNASTGSAPFTYLPAVTGVAPSSGPATGGTNITITGGGFVTGDAVVIGQGNGAGTGRIAATSVNVVSPTQITATTGGGAKGGTWNVFVVDASNNASSGSAPFTYVPVVASVTPNSGPAAGGTSVTITGSGFIAGDTVVIGQGNGAGPGRIAMTSVVVVNSGQITATTGGGALTGTWHVFVVDPGSHPSIGTSSDLFTYS